MRGYKSLRSAITTTFLLAGLAGVLAAVPYSSLLSWPTRRTPTPSHQDRSSPAPVAEQLRPSLQLDALEKEPYNRESAQGRKR
jgi:hypothetical protein